MVDIELLRFPTGKYAPPSEITENELKEWISIIKELPEKLEEEVANLSVEALNWIYRPEGWNIKQVVHHLADSHMNSIIRFKLAMTEDNPTVRPYLQDKWAALPDATNIEIASSLNILKGVHSRMVILFESMSAPDWKRPLHHPEYETPLALGWMLGMYAWHSNHHLAHVRQAIKHQGHF
ncbi:MAG: YfiT family bacillithiol transferase [Bacteroidota bacterium]